MIRTLCIVLMILTAGGLNAQEPEYLELIKAENQLRALFLELYSDSVPDPEPVLAEIQSIMPAALEMEGAMEYPWSRLDRIGVKTSEDKKVRVFTWHVEDDPDHYRYFGYIQVALKRGKTGIYPLVDNFKPQRSVYNLEQSTENWYGKLYYSIVTKSVKRKTWYTLMGMDFNDSRSNLKFVEVLVIHRNKPRFEKQVFFNGRDKVDRVVLEYSDQVAITVRYDPNLDLIAYDHLVPLHPIYQNNYEFYGPDGSFGGLEFSSGTWIVREDIDARLQY